MKILIINDERDLVDVCSLILESEGHETRTEINWRRALDVARRFQPDLIILDWVLDGSSGDYVLLALRRDRATAAIPVLMISALADGRARAEMIGADGFLPKPFDGGGLLDAVRTFLPYEDDARV